MSGTLADTLFNTQLTPAGEQLYQQQVPPGANYDYDMRGAWAQLGGNLPAQGMHFTDQFKKPNHPTFSSGSMYSTPIKPGGNWAQMPDGRWVFAPSETNRAQFGQGNLQQYFDKVEPDSLLLNLPR